MLPLRYLREVGLIQGPTKVNGQTTFCVILSVCDETGAEIVHEKKDGTKVPWRLTTYPIDTDEVPGISLPDNGNNNRIIL